LLCSTENQLIFSSIILDFYLSVKEVVIILRSIINYVVQEPILNNTKIDLIITATKTKKQYENNLFLEKE